MQQGSGFALQQKVDPVGGPLLEPPLDPPLEPSGAPLLDASSEDEETACPLLHAATATAPPARIISLHRLSQRMTSIIAVAMPHAAPRTLPEIRYTGPCQNVPAPAAG